MTPYDNASGAGTVSEDSGVPPTGGHVTISRLDELPEAKAYLDRIGAKATGPWSAAIHVERDGYEFDRSSVKLEYEVHGTTASITGVKYWGDEPDLAPTDAERAAILEAAKHVRWPRPFLRYGLGHDLPEDMAEALRTGNIYIFYDGERDPRTCYVQTHHPGVTGRGKYRSWVHIDTQEWISGQPNDLPLYGLDQVGKMAEGVERVFIHEGPKAAEMVKRYLDPDREDNRLDHPWAEFLATGIHIGWPGGGNRYRRVDWSPLQALAKLKGLPVVVVADDDMVGVEAAEAISEEYIPGKRDIKVLVWPEGLALKKGFDLADLWPVNPPALEGMLRSPRYVGDAQAIELTPVIEAVAKRIGERGLAFNFSGSVTRVLEEASEIFKDPGDPERKLPAKTLRTVIISEPLALTKPVEEVSRWQAWSRTEEEYVPRRVPDKILKLLVAHPEDFPELIGVIDHAVIKNGKLLTGKLGFDPESKLYINSPPVELVEFNDAKEALRFLTEDWLGPFPFQTQEDRLRALLIPLQILLRRTEVTGGAPYPFVTAASAQTGKSWLVRMLYFALSGAQPPLATFETDPKEFGKQFIGALLEASSLVYYDNVKNGWHVGNPDLDAYATSDTFSKRLLGKNKDAKVSARATVVLAGNNIVPEGDTVTRSFEVRLFRGEENEDLRLTKVKKFTEENRGRILGALLAIANTPPEHVPNVRFRDWARIVAAPLMTVADEPGLLVAMEQSRSEVMEGGDDLAVVMSCVHRLQKDGFVFAKTLANDADAAVALHRLFRMKDNEKVTSQTVSTRMTAKRDAFAGGMLLRIGKAWDQKDRKFRTAYSVEGEPEGPELPAM